jgi:hypothetical protein
VIEKNSASKRRFAWSPVLHVVAGLVAVGLMAEAGCHLAFSGRRRAVVRVMASLHKGMPRVDVERLLDREAAHFFVTKRSSDGLLFWAHAGSAAAWGVQVRFTPDGRLASATVSTEDGPYHPKGVPADIQ